jgi:hypothetical protein
MALGSFTSFTAGTTIVASQMNANFAAVTSWSSEVARLDGAAFTGACTWTNTITVGSDGTGYDVKFFGDTAGAYMLWDQSVDDLILAGAARIVIPDGQLVLASTAVTATAAELNIMDGVTANTGEINILDGVTATYVEINVLDGVTGGTVTASKAVVVDANADITAFRNITATGDVTAVNAVFSGDITCQDAITFEGSSADAHETTIAVTNPTADRTFTIADQNYTLLRNIYVQASEPSGGDYFTGDLWIDT